MLEKGHGGWTGPRPPEVPTRAAHTSTFVLLFFSFLLFFGGFSLFFFLFSFSLLQSLVTFVGFTFLGLTFLLGLPFLVFGFRFSTARSPFYLRVLFGVGTAFYIPFLFLLYCYCYCYYHHDTLHPYGPMDFFHPYPYPLPPYLLYL